MNFKQHSLRRVTVVVTLLLVFHGVDAAKLSQNKCQKQGKQCNGCQQVYTCIQREGILVLDGKIEKCPGTQVCDASKSVARCEPNAVCRYKEFECPTTSEKTIFPDPFSCGEYHICIRGKALNFVCGNDSPVFDSKTKRCVNETSTKNACKNPPVPPCERKGDTGTIEGTDYFYECMEETTPHHVLYPKVNIRVNGGTVISDLESTSQSTSTGTESTISSTAESMETSQSTSSGTESTISSTTESMETSQSTSSGTESTMSSTTESMESSTAQSTFTGSSTSSATTSASEPTTSIPQSTMTPMPWPCTNGVGVYPVPEDCRKYYVCFILPDNTLGYKEKMCHAGSHFENGRCVKGSCDHFPTTVSPATIETTVTPVDCQSEGPLPDKGCCKCYYICFNDGGVINYAHKCCRYGSHFDYEKKKCVAGSKCTPTDTC